MTQGALALSVVKQNRYRNPHEREVSDYCKAPVKVSCSVSFLPPSVLFLDLGVGYLWVLNLSKVRKLCTYDRLAFQNANEKF